MDPRITVFMPVYNGEKYLQEAIESILNQTYKNFEFLIINDGSTDRSVEIIESYKDPRIKLLHNGKNIGLVDTRNRGIQESKGEFLAVMDCDDVAYPQRLEKEIKFLEARPDFAMVASWVEVIDHASRSTGIFWKNTYLPEKIPAILLFTNCFTHSAALIRKSALPEDGYRHFGGACEYDLWIRMTQKWKLWTLPEILLKYRNHEENMSNAKREAQQQNINEIIKSQLQKLAIISSLGELKIHRTNYNYKGSDLMDFLERRKAWLERLKKANDEIRRYSEPEFSEVISDRWLASCSANARGGLKVWKKFWSSPMSKWIKKSDWKPIAKFFIKCLLRKDNLK